MVDSKRILYLANLHPNKFGSMEEHALFLSRELKQRGYQLFIGFISDPDPEIRHLFEESGAQVVTVYCGNTPLVGNKVCPKCGEMLALRRMVIENKIDLVHINFMGVTNPMLLGIYLTKVKIVFTEHASGSAPNRNPVKHLLSWCMHFLISKRISKYIAVSDFVRNRLKVTHHVSEDKTVTIYNGVNIDRFCPQDKNKARQELGLPLNIPIISTVAMLIPEKGIQHLIEATSILVKEKKLPCMRTIVVGEGGYRSHLEMLCIDFGVTDNVFFWGRRSDVQTIIAASDVVVVPSIWEEAFGLIVAETMACGRPLVASHSGGIPELIEDGLTGHFFPCGDSQQMAEVIDFLLSNALHRNKLGQNSREKTLCNFNLSSQVNQLIKIYQEALNHEN
jgi:glycosyltransferase involved in cell wall biosynthesis